MDISDSDIEREAFVEAWVTEELTTPDGSLDRSKIVNELFDYSILLDEVPLVYMDISDGKVSQVNTHTQVLVDMLHDRIEAARAEGYSDGFNAAQQGNQ